MDSKTPLAVNNKLAKTVFFPPKTRFHSADLNLRKMQNGLFVADDVKIHRLPHDVPEQIAYSLLPGYYNQVHPCVA